MKITKLLPLALALTLAVPAFAEVATGDKSAQSELQINVPQFINITRNEGAMVEAAAAGFDADYANITLDKSLTASFHVVTNNPDEKVKLTATALAGGSQVNALYGNDGTELNIVFTNNGTGSRAATASAVTDIMTAPSKTGNANAIAFKLTPTITPKPDTGAAAPTPSKQSDHVEYPIVNGEYDFVYTVGTTALANTFSTHDTDGTYKATITLSQVSP